MREAALSIVLVFPDIPHDLLLAFYYYLGYLCFQRFDDSVSPSQLSQESLELSLTLVLAMLGLKERVGIDLDLINFLDDFVCPLLIVFDLVNMFVGLLTIAPLAHVGILFAVNF